MLLFHIKCIYAELLLQAYAQLNKKSKAGIISWRNCFVNRCKIDVEYKKFTFDFIQNLGLYDITEKQPHK